MSDSSPGSPPQPLVESPDRRWRTTFSSKMWLATIACVLLAMILVTAAWTSSGETITVSFMDGHGIKPGDTLRYRSTAVGAVTHLALTEDLERLDVQIRLEPGTKGLAREGSQFWIVRPQLSLSRARGLDTVVGANYVVVQPGPSDGPRLRRFTGRESPPTLNASSTTGIQIHFQNGHGLQVGDVIKFRGIDVGEVTAVQLDAQMQHVLVRAQLASNAAILARQGTQFWIERPTVAISGVSGLDTLVQGRHIAVLPGMLEGEVLTEFEGLEEAPISSDMAEGGLEFILESPQRYGLSRGAPIKFRGINVGRITSLGLSSDATRVEARAFVEPEFAQLIRTNTMFWPISGMGFEIGFGGIQVDLDSLSSLAVGGIALATPAPSGELVKAGHRFELRSETPEDALTTQASIPVGSRMLPENLPLPHPLKTLLRVQKKGWLGSTREQSGWGLLQSDNRLMILNDLPNTTSDDHLVTLVVEGLEIKARVDATLPTGITHFQVPELRNINLYRWPPERIRHAAQPEDCLIMADPLTTPLAIDSARLTADRGYWKLDPSISLGAQWHGAFAVSRIDGDLIGLVKHEKKQMVIVLLPGAKNVDN